ncbi:MAG TPA: hypothetical protein VK186_16245 [Candidatus Deferrimicrobium sp.]|nr:hypothetical protein [Candidatus Deferrimicrobium sp.]
MRHNSCNDKQKTQDIQKYSRCRNPGSQEESPGDNCHLEKSRDKEQKLAFSFFQTSIDRPDQNNIT